MTPFTELFVNVTTELRQATESAGEISILAIGMYPVVIGSTVASEKPQGFSALILTKYVLIVFPPVAPQEVSLK
jgi:hypothetical protein